MDRRRRDPAITSRMMAQVKNKDSKAELALRRGLHARGIRYRLQARDLPGRPDIVLPKHRLALFVDGDLWHGNAWRIRGLRSLGDLFPNRTDWWVAKITRNVARDREVDLALTGAGWSVVRLWESEVLKDPTAAVQRVVDALSAGHLRPRPSDT